WILRDHNLSKDIYLACALAIGVPMVVNPIIIFMMSKNPSAPMSAVAIGAIAGVGAGIAVSIYRVLNRTRRKVRTFGVFSTAFCCALPATVIACVASFLAAVAADAF